MKKVKLVEDDYPLVKKRERTRIKRNPRLYGLKIGDRIELIHYVADVTELKPGDKGTVTRIVEAPSNDYEIFVNWDKGEAEGANVLFASEDKWKVIRHTR